MTLFSEPGPRVFALPPGARFSSGFACGFIARSSKLSPIEIAQTQIIVNTSRTVQVIERSLADRRPPGLLPSITPVSDLLAQLRHEDSLGEAIAPVRRTLRLTRLVERFLMTEEQAGEPLAPLSAATDLADALALLIDQFHDEGIDPATMTRQLVAEAVSSEAALHWDRTLRFVDLVRAHWPAICTEFEQGAVDPRQRQRQVVERLVAQWTDTPPDHPIIAAASTGSVKSTAILMAAIAKLPRGCVVLPGFDPGMERAIWDNAEADHPYGPFRNLLTLLDMVPSDVRPWHETSAAPRLHLLTQAMRPAPVTDFWHAAAPQLLSEIGPATQNLTLIEAETPRHEATAIALAIREALDVPDRLIALVTPDASLARRVVAALARFDIIPDDSLGKPLSQSPPGVLLRMILDVAGGQTDPVSLAALLQHPIVRPGLPRSQHLKLARAYERTVLRRGEHPGLSLFPPWPDASPEDQGWLQGIEATLSPLRNALHGGQPLSVLVTAHRAAAEALSHDGEAAVPEIWAGVAGDQIEAFLDTLARNSDAFGDHPVQDYPSLLSSLLRDQQQRPEQQTTHPRVSIWGTREARILEVDLLILAGLNDGIWPAAPVPDPWLSRPMRVAIGLPLPERTVGLSAHDFLQAACQPEVILTRSRKIDGTPTVASRWLIRLENLMNGTGGTDAWDTMRARGQRFLALTALLDRPVGSVLREQRPAPCPPLAARPRQLSVTQIETLIRDAYAIYARFILKLKPLDPLGRAPDYRERGITIHRLMETFTERTTPWPGADQAHQILIETARSVLREDVPWPDLRRIWQARIDRFAEWFITSEQARRAHADPFRPERPGALTLDLPGGPFVVTAKADRIDKLRAGGASVYDYKTGEPPTAKQIKQGFNHQLHIQAAILQSGGFEGIPALEAKSGAFIGLTGSDPGGKETPLTDLDAQVSQHMRQLRELLEAYDNGARYRSLGMAQFSSHQGDYDHLARRGEWEGEDTP